MYNSKQHKIRLGFKEDDNNKILFESQEVYLSNMSFFNKLFKAYDLLEEGELSAAKDYLQVIVKSHPDNYKIHTRAKVFGI